MQTVSRLKAIRELRGMAAAELARRAGVSRQTVYAMEAGSYVPNTAVALLLARVLEVRVEDLFQIDSSTQETRPLEVELLDTGTRPVEGQPLRLCRVGARTVAVPAVVHPMWLPDADAVVAGYSGQSVQADAAADPPGEDKRLLVAGCDPGLSVARQQLAASGIDMALVPCGSRQALEWLKEGRVHVAGSHLKDSASGEFNLPAIRRLFPRGGFTVVTFASWEEGIVVARGNPQGIHAVSDLARRTVKIVNREPGAGSRDLLDRLLEEAGLGGGDVRGYQSLAPGHLAAAWRVQSGEADACIATRLAARALGLDFLPLAAERFDLVATKRSLATPAVQALFEVLNRAALRRGLQLLAGYDTSETGAERS